MTKEMTESFASPTSRIPPPAAWWDLVLGGMEIYHVTNEKIDSGGDFFFRNLLGKIWKWPKWPIFFCEGILVLGMSRFEI